jgi:hypothetical protein
MRLLSCPKPENLFEWVSIPQELPLWSKVALGTHTMTCSSCQDQVESLRRTWQAYFTPEPDITSTLMKVYSRLQKDETLILKGWKLGEFRPEANRLSWSQHWVVRGGLVMGLGSIVGLVVLTTGIRGDKTGVALMASAKVPLAQIRYEDKNIVKVRYVQPELLQSIEFETTSVDK